MKAERLARVLKSMTDGTKPAERTRAVDSFLSYVKVRGYQALLPRILAEYQSLTKRSEANGTTVSLAKKRDHADILRTHSIEGDANVIIDESLIGGYRIETESTLIDASHKNALLKLYHSITK